jgi:biopolymer transport protein ExbD
MRTRHEMKKPERLNLIPIMDAVFIFIFFLLMSAQFVNVFELGSSVPMVREVKENEIDKDPLNLVIEIHAEEVVVKKGKDGVRVGAFRDEELEKMRTVLAGLKEKYPKEKVAQLRPKGKIPFHRLVKVIDHTKENPKTKIKLFEEIVFDGKGVI